VNYDPNPADERILDALEAGTRNPSWLADELDYTRQYVYQRLQRLVDAELVANLGHGLYELQVDGWRADEAMTRE
jgi:DNA-binding IclR family transcriptional regulator